MFEISVYKAQSETINDDLISSSRKLKSSTNKIELNEKSLNQSKSNLKDCKTSQKNQIKIYENNEKKFKLLKKYGDILIKVEKLLGLIPSSVENLSVEELNEKLESLLKARKKNLEQLEFIFYQNLLSDLLTNLINVEKDYQEGTISSAQALSKIKLAKHQVKQYVGEMPIALHDSLKQSSDLIKMYEESFSQIVEKTNQNESSVLIETVIKIDHEILFNKINSQTQETIGKINSLSADLSNFEPQVDLSSLVSNLNETQSIISQDNWDFDKMDSAISNLDRTTNTLTDQQIAKNQENEKLTDQINELSNKTKETTKQSTYDVSEQTFKEATLRAQTAKTNVEIASEMEIENNKFATDIQKQISETVITNLENDEDFSDLVAMDPDAAVEFKNETIIEESKNAAVELLEKTEQYELEVGMVKCLQKEIEEDDDENNDPNKNNNTNKEEQT